MLNDSCFSIRLGTAMAIMVVTAATVSSQILNITSYTTGEGLVASQVWRVHQDSRGYMWFATSGGISRYDGVSFTNFTAADGIAAGVTRTIEEDSEGSLWFGTSVGASRFDGRHLEHFDRRDGLGRGVIWASAIDHYGHIWFGTQEGGASVFVDGAFRTFTTADGLAEDYVYELHADSAGHLWIGYRSAGLTRCDIDASGDLSRCRHFGVADGLPHDTVRAIVEASDGTVYIGTRGGGVASFDGHGFTTWSTSNGLAGDDVYALLIRQNGNLVIATVENGVSICEIPDFGSCQTVNKQNGLLVDSVMSLFEDREMNLWFGLNSGVSKLASERFESLTDREGLPTSRVNAVFVDANDDVWIGTIGGLARVRCSPAGRRHYDVRSYSSIDGLPANSVWDVLRDRRGSLWVGTGGGLGRLSKEGRFETLIVNGEPVTEYILDLFEDKAGNLWLGTNRGLTLLRWPADGGPPRLTDYGVADGLAGGNVYTVAEDRFGNIWVGSIGYGLSVFDGDTFHNYPAGSVPVGREVFALCVATDGAMWIGSAGGGVARAQPANSNQGTTFERFGPERGLGPADVRAIFEDDQGLLWLGTSRGIFQIDPSVPAGQDAVILRFDTASGLIGNEVVTGNAIAEDRQGTIWFGFSDGVSRYLPHVDTNPLRPPPVAIERVATGSGLVLSAPFSCLNPEAGRQQPCIDDHILELPYHDNNVRFDYRGLIFASENEVHYQVQLQGFDAKWSPPTPEPYKEYTNLNPGHYTFLVRACSRNGSWISDAAGFELVLHPPFWHRWWFFALTATIICFALVAGHRARVRKIRVRARELEALVAERTEELNQQSLALREHARKLEQAYTRIQVAGQHKSDFLANMSHELRTPMNAIIGFSDVLANKLEDQVDARLYGFLQNIQSSGRHLLRLINNLLDLSKVEAGKMEVNPEEVDLYAMVAEVRRVVAGMAFDRAIEIDVDVAAILPTVRVDAQKTKQILYNLLSNAVKFSYDRSTVVLTVRPSPPQRSELDVESFEILVVDQGIGIKPEEQQSIFEGFFQADNHTTISHGGTGLGLAIVRHFVRLMGGSLSVKSAPHQGSTFRVELPIEASE